jgi:hypothetical protein
VSTKDASQCLDIGPSEVARIDKRLRDPSDWQAELGRCNVDIGPTLVARGVSPPVGSEQGARSGHENHEDSNDRHGQRVHERQSAPRCNQPSEWCDDVEPQGRPKRS